MATGQLPFRGESSGVIFNAILELPPVSAVRLNPDLPPQLEDIINKALEKDRNLRYQHACDMRADLQRLKRDRESERSAAANATVVQEAPAFPSKKLWASALLMVLLFAALIVGGLYYRSNQTKPLTEKDAAIELSRNNCSKVLVDLEPAASYELGVAGMFINYLYPVYVRGQAYRLDDTTRPGQNPQRQRRFYAEAA